MKSTVTKSIVITGVSTGIGHGTAVELCRRGFRVFGSVRTDEQAARLQRELGTAFTPLLFDVTDADAIGRAVATVRGRSATAGCSAWSTTPALRIPAP